MLFSNKIILLVSNRVSELLSPFCYQAYVSSIWRKLKEKLSKLFSKWLILFFVHAYGIQCLNQLLLVTGLMTGIKWPLKVVQVFSRRHEKRDSLVTWEIFHINFQNKCSLWPLHTVFLNFKMALNQKQCFTKSVLPSSKVIELVLFVDVKKKIYFFLLAWGEKLVYIRLV